MKNPDFTRTSACRLRVHCHACRTSAVWRATAVRAGLAATPEWECPAGYSATHLPSPEEIPQPAEMPWQPATWEELHTHEPSGDAATDAAWLEDFTRRIPNINCTCRAHWRAWLAKHPAPLANPIRDAHARTSHFEEWFRWSVEAHNAVNARLGKPQISQLDAAIIWIRKFIDRHPLNP